MSKTAADSLTQWQDLRAVQVRQDLMRQFWRYMGMGAGMGAAARGLQGLYNVQRRGSPHTSALRPVTIAVPAGDEEEPEPKRRKRAGLMSDLFAGRLAESWRDHPAAAVVLPTALVGGGVGAWQLTDKILDARRRADQQEEQRRARLDYEAALRSQHKHAADVDADREAAMRQLGLLPPAVRSPVAGQPPLEELPSAVRSPVRGQPPMEYGPESAQVIGAPVSTSATTPTRWSPAMGQLAVRAGTDAADIAAGVRRDLTPSFGLSPPPPRRQVTWSSGRDATLTPAMGDALAQGFHTAMGRAPGMASVAPAPAGKGGGGVNAMSSAAARPPAAPAAPAPVKATPRPTPPTPAAVRPAPAAPAQTPAPAKPLPARRPAPAPAEMAARNQAYRQRQQTQKTQARQLITQRAMGQAADRGARLSARAWARNPKQASAAESATREAYQHALLPRGHKTAATSDAARLGQDLGAELDRLYDQLQKTASLGQWAGALLVPPAALFAGSTIATHNWLSSRHKQKLLQRAMEQRLRQRRERQPAPVFAVTPGGPEDVLEEDPLED